MSEQNVFLLTAEQQMQTDERALHVAELTKAGARTAATGTLLLTAAQVELATLYHDPLGSSIEDVAEASPMQQWLDQPITDLPLYADNMLFQKRIVNSLQRERIYILRDIAVVGRFGLQDIRNFGALSIGLVEAQFTDNPYGVRLLDHPTPEDIAKFCERLSDVHALSLNNLALFPYLWAMKKLTVQDVLDMSHEEIKAAYSRHSDPAYVKLAATTFAAKFRRARQNLNAV